MFFLPYMVLHHLFLTLVISNRSFAKPCSQSKNGTCRNCFFCVSSAILRNTLFLNERKASERRSPLSTKSATATQKLKVSDIPPVEPILSKGTFVHFLARIPDVLFSANSKYDGVESMWKTLCRRKRISRYTKASEGQKSIMSEEHFVGGKRERRVCLFVVSVFLLLPTKKYAQKRSAPLPLFPPVYDNQRLRPHNCERKKVPKTDQNFLGEGGGEGGGLKK